MAQNFGITQKFVTIIQFTRKDYNVELERRHQEMNKSFLNNSMIKERAG